MGYMEQSEVEVFTQQCPLGPLMHIKLCGKISNFFGFSLDFIECFDRIPCDVAIYLRAYTGLPWWLAESLRYIYVHMSRRLCASRACSDPSWSLVSIFQGCALACVTETETVRVAILGGKG